MKHKELLIFAISLVLSVAGALTAAAEDQTIGQQVSILDERLSKLRADVDALQFNQQQIQQDIKQLQTQLAEARQSGPSASVILVSMRASHGSKDSTPRTGSYTRCRAYSPRSGASGKFHSPALKQKPWSIIWAW